MNRLVIFIFSLAIFPAFFSGCKNGKTQVVVTRDSTITPQTAVTSLILDSNRVEQFIINEKLEEQSAERFRNFYISRNFQFTWFDENGLTEQLQAFWNLHNYYINLNQDSSLYDKRLQETMVKYAEDSTYFENMEDRISNELKLTEHFFKYAQYAYAGKINPEELQWHIPRKKLNVVALLDSLVKNKGNNLEKWEPVNARYLDMQKGLVKYADIEKKGGWDTVPVSSKLKPGSRDSLVLLFKKRLSIEGDFNHSDTSILYDSALDAAVKNARSRYGMNAKGGIDKAFCEALNTPVRSRIKQILLNMERMRWLPAPESNRIIVANIPDFKLRVFENNEVVLSMNIVVGKEATKSVIFTDVLQYVVFAPYWNVPSSIARNEIVPAMRRNKNYLKRNNMEITGYSRGIPIIRQRPGGSNALGKVKFIFPNSYNIYFHDTPSKSLFEQDKRAFSHGCIRIQKPFEMAKYLLGNQLNWTDEKILDEMDGSKENWITLPEPIPVFITYFTAYVGQDEKIYFLNDIYGHDKKLEEKLFQKTSHPL